MPPQSNASLEFFHPAIQNWFRETFTETTPPQKLGWPVIQRDENVLILAPTGSGKTLAAFLVCINKLLERLLAGETPTGVFILYISPLKALNYDIEKNLEIPLAGIRRAAREMEIELPLIRQAVRTGDTPQDERQRMLKHPPQLLITTPESLHLLLTSKHARKMLASVHYVIVDEIHALSGDKRGTFLMLLLERLQKIARQNFTRIGLSATQKPLDKIAAFLGGFEKTESGFQPRPVQIVDAGMRKQLDLQVISPVEDMTNLPQESIWPAIFTKLHELINAHQTTLIFANNRAIVEKITGKVNALANASLVKSHHGSISKNVRKELENQLKAGELSALAATATLELGIDMGAIDLVCQVESPHSVATGLQRVGRAGHLYKSASKGRLLPKMRSDLLEMAAITRGMSQGAVAAIKIPENCLDILAQQIVAMVALEDWAVDDLFDTIRGATPFSALPRPHFLAVLEMLSGRYHVETFRNLRPLISWDRINNRLYPLPGSQRLVILNGGAIPETGQYPVYLQDGMVRLGELEEEFVYEARLGDNFQLGTSTWKIISIEPNRVLVVAASGQSAKIPFWKGDLSGRDPELGQQVGLLSRQIKERLKDPNCENWLQEACFLDADAARNLVAYFKLQQQKAGAIPDDRTILVESFRDEMGDPRLAILTPFGRRMHYAWRLAILAYLQQIWKVELESIDGDGGILFRYSGVDAQQLMTAIKNIHRENLEELLSQKLAGSPLFGIRFRHNAGRALLLPRRMPGKRTPLWLLRMRSRALLEVVDQFESFPIVVETYREILQDFFEMEALKTLLDQIAAGEIQLIFRTSDTPSPFCAQLLFDFTAGYQYQYDEPKNPLKNGPVHFNFDFLNELVHAKNLPELIGADIVQDLEERLQGLKPGYGARDENELIEMLHRLGDLSTDDLRRRFQGPLEPALEKLTRQHRLLQIQLNGIWRWIASEDFPIYQAAFAQSAAPQTFEFVCCSAGPELVTQILPREILNQSYDPLFALRTVLLKQIDHRTFLTISEITARFPVSAEVVRQIFSELAARELIVRLPADTTAAEERWILRETLERLRRGTLKKQRQEVQPCDTTQFVHFLLEWQHFSEKSQLSGEAGLVALLEQMQGRALPFSIWENEIIARRIQDYQPRWLAELITDGEIVWSGKKAGVAETGNLYFSFYENLQIIAGLARTGESPVPEARQILEVLAARGACFLTDIAGATGLRPAQCAQLLWDLIWDGQVTNDSLRVLNSGRPKDHLTEMSATEFGHQARWQRHPWTARRPGKRPASGGRWSRLPETAAELTEEMTEAYIRMLLLRYGMLCRELFELEDAPLPWRSIFELLVRLEWRGEIRRGYFVKGFSGIQFALPVVADQLLALHRSKSPETEFILINSCDPANLFGAGAPLTLGHPVHGDWQFRRQPQNYLILRGGIPLLAIESLGKRLTPLQLLSDPELKIILEMLPRILIDPTGLGHKHWLKIELWDGQPIRKSPAAPILEQLGFRNEFTQLVLERKF
jgi:ATP-dependent Lhr-like helicase